MLNMTMESKAFLEKYLPNVVSADKCNDILIPLYDLIMYQGFDEEYDYNAFGVEAQAVYDDIYDSNN